MSSVFYPISSPDTQRDLTTRQQAARARLLKSGIPGTRQEDWKYTDLAGIAALVNRSIDSQVAKHNVAYELPAIDAHWIVIARGDLVESPDLPNGISLDADGTQLSVQSSLADLGEALGSTFLHLRIDAGVSLEKPLGFFFIDDAAMALSQCRILISQAEGSQVQYVEVNESDGEGEQYANCVIELQLGNNALADYTRLQQRDDKHLHTHHLQVNASRDSRFRFFGADLGGGLARNDVVIDITEPGAEVELDGVFLAGDKQHVDNHTRIDHRVGPARSRQEYRGVILGRAVWNGKAVVHEGADGTDAEQANHNLLLSDSAEVNAKPELEIYAEDVKCAHGTTVGQLDENALFYLRSRGLDTQQGRRLLIQAFVTELVERCPVEAAAELARELIEKRLEDLIRGMG